jgi:hypothetical protein|tara:strand:+ start:276 stop:422 length:147 start_codon:yes stop_codon:yes gene_type:complete
MLEDFLRGRLFIKRAWQELGPPLTAHWQRLGGIRRLSAVFAGKVKKSI